MTHSILPDILPPYSSPAWCEHGPIAKTCSRCDPSEASGRIRASEARRDSTSRDRTGHLGHIEEDMGAAIGQER